MAILIDGKKTSEKIRLQIKEETAKLFEKTKKVPGLAVIIVGNDPSSKIYVRNKKRACEEVGFLSREYALDENTPESELISLIEKLNNDDEINGILVQSPVPKHINEKCVVETISPYKDVDAFRYESVGRIVAGNFDFLPCTPAGVMVLLREYGIDPAGKEAVVVGRSDIVGKPQALLLLHANATVTIAHSKTADLAKVTRRADILVTAVGKPKFITGDMVKDGVAVIDVGMNRTESGLFGDVDFESVSPKASYITPVPGGVGPMTITMLLQNTLTAFKAANC